MVSFTLRLENHSCAFSLSLTKYFKLQRLRDTARHQNILYATDLMISFFNFTYIEIFYSVKVVIFEVASQT